MSACSLGCFPPQKSLKLVCSLALLLLLFFLNNSNTCTNTWHSSSFLAFNKTGFNLRRNVTNALHHRSTIFGYNKLSVSS